MLLNSSFEKGTNFNYSCENFQKLRFDKSLHCTKQRKKSEHKYILHCSNKNSFKNKNKGYSFFNLFFFAIKYTFVFYLV